MPGLFFRTYLVRRTMSNGRMTNDESKRMWKEATVTVPTVYSRIFLEGLRQTMNSLCQNNLAARLRIVPGSTKHDAGVPTASPRRSVFSIYYFNRESLNISTAVKSGKCRPILIILEWNLVYNFTHVRIWSAVQAFHYYQITKACFMLHTTGVSQITTTK